MFIGHELQELRDNSVIFVEALVRESAVREEMWDAKMKEIDLEK